MTQDIRILGIGSPIVDALAHVSDDFLHSIPGEKGGMDLVEASMIEDILEKHDDAVHRAPGGSASNTIVGLAKLGIATAFLGKLGKDDLAQFYEEQLCDAGVDIEGIKYCEVSPTGHCLSLITPDAERTMRTHLGAACGLVPADIHVDDFAGFTHAHVEGHLLHDPILLETILSCAKQAGCTVSYDLGHYEVVKDKREHLEAMLDKYVDMAFANEDEAKAYAGSDDILMALDKLATHCDISAVKLGPKGCWVQSATERVRVEAIPTEAVDSTGAGDLWAVGFLYAYYRGGDLEACGRAGSLLGAKVVEQIGAMIPDHHWENLKEKLHDESNSAHGN